MLCRKVAPRQKEICAFLRRNFSRLLLLSSLAVLSIQVWFWTFSCCDDSSLECVHPETLGKMMETMNRVDRWFETRPALSRFLDPPCVVVESLAPGGGPVAGLGNSIAANPAQHGAVQLLPDTVAGGGATWDNVIACATKEAAMATATLIRGRHAGPGGVGGGVEGTDPCRVMYFNMTNANHVEF